MATRSRTSSRAQSPFDQGYLEPQLPPTSALKLGEVSLERVTRLLLGLLGHVKRLERDITKIKKQGSKQGPTSKTFPKPSMCQGWALKPPAPRPRTPEGPQAKAVEETPRPLPKAKPIGSTSGVSFWQNPKALPSLAQPTPRRAAPPRVPSPPPSPRLRSPIGAPAPPPQAPVAAYPARSAYQNAAWTQLNSRMFPTNQEVLSFLLMNMKDAAGAWAHPHLNQLGSHRAIIQTVEDSNWSSWQLLATLTPQGPRAEDHLPYPVRNLRGLYYEVQDPCHGTGLERRALRGQFARGLHWEVSRQIATREHRPRTLLELQNAALVIDNALRKERASHPPRDSKPSKPSNPARGTSTGQSTTGSKKLSDNPNFVSEEEQNRRRAAGACIKCGKMGHKFAECRTGWKATPIEDKGKAKETAKIGKDSDSQLGKERYVIILTSTHCGVAPPPSHRSPLTPYRYYARWVKPPGRKNLEEGSTYLYLRWQKMTETFLICNTGNHAAILGLKWLDAHNPEIDWNARTLSFPHTPPEHVFGEEEFNKLPPHRHYDIGIELTEEGPLNSPLYSMTDAESSTLKDWLRDELKAGKICPSKSSISSPVMFVPKKDGSRRLVVDYRRLNNRTKKNVYPLPRPDDLMAQLRGAKEGDKWKTAFRTKYGLYESLVMTFGLTNAPAAFQHFMNELFKDLLDVCVIIYLDDILIYSKDDVSHTQHVHEVLKRLMENQLFCKASKCTFHVTSVEYLGIIVSDKGFNLDKLKIQAVQEWPVPTKVKEVQSFLGFANFLRRFVANFSHLARPLHNLVKKDTPWKWEEREQEAFQGLKDAITNAPVLCHANPSKPYFLETNASGAALGSILSQRQEDGRLHPLGFLSKSFKGAEQNYDTHNKELLAIICSFEYWRIFLEGTAHPITVFTNHRNLEYWKESRTFNCCHARWHLLLAGYNFQIVYRPGKQSGKPNALSRRADHANIPPDAQTMLPNPVFANVALGIQEGSAPWNWYQGTITGPAYAPTHTGTSIPAKLVNGSGNPMDLPKDGSNDSILVIVDSFTKYVILVECSKKLKAPELANLFLQHVWKHYSMPEKTILDRGRVFNNKFLKALYQRLGIDPHFSSAYHPQSDRQTERVNPTVEHFLRAYSGTNQRDWVKWLPMAEFAYNNAVHSATGKSPFKALYGWEPSLTPSNVPTDVPEADQLATQMEAQWREIESALRQSKLRMTAGETGEPLEFKIGRSLARRQKREAEDPKSQANGTTPRPLQSNQENLQSRIPPGTPAVHENPQCLLCGITVKITVDGEEEYEVEGITDMEKRGEKWFFRVKWKGYGSEENTWEPRENLKNAEEILKKFEKE
ncbi:hypothetical protein RHS01_08361 [Rhizoctonia solani]|uniref:Retrotransposable element Tf2 155 kDa protein type 1 n=1 Tax=Rhizoctonia solani TaxID=456999 RepID=A0A8H7M4B1_9AGAM|nr:hypothetical protein RHS01_08361 [Rhizoctonia solani]